MMTKKERDFQTFVLDWYEKCGRQGLPWRDTQDPYAILVSELMLQQTQVVRVVPKFEAFLRQYPTVHQLAEASVGDVLRLWQGLGYNRRAKFLHQCAQVIVSDYSGSFPVTELELQNLPGIGPYTASAVCAFAYNQPVVLVETNVRQVMIHHFFSSNDVVTDAEILHVVERTVPSSNARNWYAALMDYGTHLKAVNGNNTRKVKGHVSQSKFKGSNREVRAAIIRVLVQQSMSKKQLKQALEMYAEDKIEPQLKELLLEDMVLKKAGRYMLP